MSLVKRLYLSFHDQLRVRQNLYQMRDYRAFSPTLSKILLEASKIWPEVLPWKPRTILDIGAHRGTIAEQLAQLYHPRFVGLVEPLPQMAALLQAKPFAPQQKVFSCALGRCDGRAVLNVLASMPSSSLLEVAAGCDVLFHRPMDKTDTIEVPVRTLDGIFSECGLQDLDLLKIDVQGYEIEVFAGGTETLRKTRLIVTEVSFFEHYQGQPLFGEVYNFLHGAGFELRDMFGYIYESQGLPLQCDAVFINRAMPRPESSG
jgi:FkbM family methyltransferase